MSENEMSVCDSCYNKGKCEFQGTVEECAERPGGPAHISLDELAAIIADRDHLQEGLNNILQDTGDVNSAASGMHARAYCKYIREIARQERDRLKEELAKEREVRREVVEALEGCAEVLDCAGGALGLCGEGDGKDHKADSDDWLGIRNTLSQADTAIAKELEGKDDG